MRFKQPASALKEQTSEHQQIETSRFTAKAFEKSADVSACIFLR